METFRAAILDTETTGAGRGDQVVEIAILVHEYSLETGAVVREVASYQSLNEPTVAIHPTAQAIHGLSMKELHGHRMEESDIVRVLRGCHAVVAHNVPFDRGMMCNHFTWMETLPWRCSCWSIPWKSLGFESGKLQSLLTAHQIDPGSAHRAMDDVRGLHQLMQRVHPQTGMHYMWHAVKAEELATVGVGAGFDPWG
ncbi:MAG: exonuclease domain-containing protein [Planctomycetota bacterium]|nr:exonuclease domain-containing protein [Planctomycetota bacterium]